MSTELSLAQKIQIWIGKTISRNDVKIESIKVPFGESLSKWKDKLPEEIMLFHNQMNGLEFLYTIKNSSFNGLNICSLDSGGKKTFGAKDRINCLPLQKASAFPKYFLNEESDISPEDQILFHIGHDSAWGMLLVGEGDSQGYQLWDNDGFTSGVNKTFTELIEQGIDRHFGPGWYQKEIHPDNQELIDLLKTEDSQPKKSFELTVNELDSLDENAYRYYLGTTWNSYVFNNVTKALNLDPSDYGTTSEDYGRFVQDHCSDPSKYKAEEIKSLMKALGQKKRTKKAFLEYFRIGLNSVAKLNVSLKHVSNKLSECATEFLLRVLQDITEGNFCHDFPLDKDILMYTQYIRHCHYYPFLLEKDNLFDKKKKENEVIFELVVTEERVEGLSQGKTYPSHILDNYYLN